MHGWRLLPVVLLAALITTGCATSAAPVEEVTVRFHYSRFEPATLRVPAGRPITITLRNDDPIEHEWIVGLPALHERHRTGTEPRHDSRPDEVTVPPYGTRVTRLTFDTPGELAYICHLPGHETYGMKGMLVVAGG